VTREKDHRQWFFGSCERFLHIQPAKSRHLQIEHHATSGLRAVAFEKRLRRGKRFDSIVRGPETPGQSAEKRGIVIHQIDNRRTPLPAFAPGCWEGFVGHEVFPPCGGPEG